MKDHARADAIQVSLIGASTRAAAFSAWRAGWRARACDLFGDTDLRHRAVFEPLTGPYPRAFVDFVQAGPRAPCIYVGGLENHPELIDRLAAYGPVWGNSGEVLRRVRDPFTLGPALSEGGFNYPESVRTRPRDHLESWLAKPLRGAGGDRIRRASEVDASTPAPLGRYYQRFVPGASYSAVYVGSVAGARRFGVTRQLVGVPWLHGSPFGWCGNIGPTELETGDVNLLDRLGHYLVERFGLRGLFGIDFLISDEDRPRSLHVVEVNPRYPASVEILELATRQSALRLHAAAFEDTTNLARISHQTPCADVIGKAVLFAPRTLVVTENLLSEAARAPFELPAAADLPVPGTEIAPGRPVLTVFARGDTEAACMEALKSSSEDFEQRWT